MNQRKRLQNIGSILTRYGFEKVVSEILPITVRLRIRGLKPLIGNEGTYVRLRKALTELGPTFIKFGQYMATRPDLLPPELVKELELIQDRSEPMPFEEVRRILEEKIGKIDEIFSEVLQEPISSESLSQKHVAILRKSGEKVVLKIERPEISDAIETDLGVLEILSKHAGKISDELKIFSYPEVVKDFSVEIQKELDLISEGKSAELISKAMEEFPKIRVPKIHWEYTGEGLLVLEYIDGVTINQIEEIAKMGVDAKELSMLCLHSYLKQIFVDGFYQGDPEPENLLVTKKGELVFIDFGVMGVLRPEKRDTFTRFTEAIFDNDVDEIVRSLQGLGLWGRMEDIELLKDDVYVALKEDRAKIRYADDNKLAGIVASVRKRGLGLPIQSMLAVNTLLRLNSDVKALYPDFQLIDELDSFNVEASRRSIGDLVNLRKTGLSLMDTIQSTKDLPQHMNDALRTVAEGPIRFKLDYENLDNLGEQRR